MALPDFAGMNVHISPRICPSPDLQGTNGGQNSRKHLQMHGKCGKQKKGRENTLT